jgi:biotin operon repressor
MIVLAATAALGTLGCRNETGNAATTHDSAAGSAPSTATAQQAVDWKAVETAIGRPGVAQPGVVHRFNFPRSDMRVTAAGVAIKPAFALGGWVAMKAATGGIVAMGDLVLSETELNPVIARLQEGGIEQTAVHHHLLHESPRVYYVHIHGHGDAVKIGETIRAAVGLTKAPPPAPPATAAGPLGIDTTQVAQALGYTGRVNGGVYQVSVPRAETIRDGTFEVPPSMGLGTAINFQPTGGGKAAITGDFVMIASEVNAVIRTLRENGIEVTSLHNHLLAEEPRLFFMHFWANDDALKLARGLRAALDRTNSKRPTS